jgi:hypothetical protein
MSHARSAAVAGEQRAQHVAQLRRQAHLAGASRLAQRAAVLPRRRAALLRACRHRLGGAARAAGAGGHGVDARAVPERVRHGRLRPLHRARPHAAAGRQPRSAPPPRQPRHRRGDGGPAQRRGVRRHAGAAAGVFDGPQRRNNRGGRGAKLIIEFAEAGQRAPQKARSSRVVGRRPAASRRRRHAARRPRRAG